MVRALAAKTIRAEEGLRLGLYKCSANKTTIGYGRNLDDRGISKAEAEFMLSNDLDATIAEIQTYSWYGSLSQARKAALISLHFQLGRSRFAGFRKMIAALQAGDYPTAAAELLDSEYSTQVPARAHRLYQSLLEG